MIETVSRTVRIMIVKDDTTIGNHVHMSGDTADCDETRAAYLVAYGDARLAPGATFSADGLARLKQFEKEKPKPPPARPGAPMVRVMCVTPRKPLVRNLPAQYQGQPCFIVGTVVVEAGGSALCREDDAVMAILRHPCDLGLAEGSQFSERGERFYSALAAGRAATY
jgi:hypothetical protein